MVDSGFDLHQFTGVTVIKPNEEERNPRRRTGDCAKSAEGLATGLAKSLSAKAALVTLGNQGMVLGRDRGVVEIPAVGSEEIVDLTGAGDSVAAALVQRWRSGRIWKLRLDFPITPELSS